MNPVVIIGGGPAGSTLGCYLSQAGIKNIIIEKANHPRPHVGESLVAATTRVFQEIGFIQTMNDAGFVRKYGATWHSPRTNDRVGIKFRDFPITGVNQSFTYHVDRARMDHLLLQHAEKMGSTVYQGIKVDRVLFDENQRARGVNIVVGNKNVELEASTVVDASGRNSIIGRQLNWFQRDVDFDQFCTHAWFEGVDRGTEHDHDDIHIYFLPMKRAWVWQIPINDQVTSIGIVLRRENFQSASEEWFNSIIEHSPNLKHATRNARRVNELKSEGDYSYCMKDFAGDGFALIGDAARFVDPIFSSGVSIAVHSAKFVSECIIKNQDQEFVSRQSFAPYVEVLRSATAIWYDFIRLYYKAPVLFTYFIQLPEMRQQLHQLLQGEVLSRENAQMLDEMREHIRAIENTDGHVFRPHLDETLEV